MRILHVVQAYYPAIGGSEWLTKNVSERLVSRYGDEVTVFTTNAYRPEAFTHTAGPFMPPGVENINGVIIRRFKVFNGLQMVRRLLAQGSHRLKLPFNDWLRTIQNGPLIRGLPKAIAQTDAQIVFSTAFPFLHMYHALAGARRGNIPIAFLGAIHVANKWDYDRKMMYEAIHQADAYIAHTTFERDHLVQQGIDVGKITVIGAGVDADRFSDADGTVFRKKYGWGDAPVVAVLARQAALKRLDILLKAMPRVWEKRPEVHLLMAGARTSFSPNIDRMIGAFAPEQQARVTVINDFSEREKPDLLMACDILAHPSANESFGIVFLEAWACGKPVIGACEGAVPSVVDAGRDGLLFSYPDPDSLAKAILELLTHPSLRKRLGQAGLEKTLANYTWDIVTERLRQVYTQIATRSINQ
jgi:glycosyltransferase involved in cell wall biosynthesis